MGQLFANRKQYAADSIFLHMIYSAWHIHYFQKGMHKWKWL